MKWVAALLLSTSVCHAQMPGTFSPQLLSPVPCVFHNLFSTLALTSLGAGFAAYTFRNAFQTSVYSNATNGSQVRVTFSAPSGGGSIISSGAWVGHAGANDQTFDGNQAQLKFGGATTISWTGDKVSDATLFAFNGTKDLIVSFAWNTSAITRASSLAAGYIHAACTSGCQAQAGSNTLTTIDDGPTTTIMDMVKLVEVCSP